MTVPSLLQPNDPVAIIPPANAIDWKYIRYASGILEKWGLRVRLSDNIRSRHHQFAGKDEERLASLQKLLDHPKIKCIFCARGGYGTTRIADRLSFKEFIKYPKWIVGYSDITVLLNMVYNLGFEGIHGPMPLNFMEEGATESLNRLRTLLFEGGFDDIHMDPASLNRTGTASGRLIGGNLALLSNSLGTPSDMDTGDCILFLEDVGEYLYKIDRMIVQMKRAGKFEHIKGLIIGQFTRLKENENFFGNTLEEIIIDQVSEYSFPVCFNAPLGHEMPNYPVPTGRAVRLSVDEKGSTLSAKD